MNSSQQRNKVSIERDRKKGILVISPPKKPQISLIWLSGSGDIPDRYLPYFTTNLPKHLSIKIKIISAPYRPISSQKNRQFRAWFDIDKSGTIMVNKLDGIQHGINLLKNYVHDEIKFYENEYSTSKINPSKRVFVGGFDQGSVIALNYSLKNQINIGGVAVFSGYMHQKQCQKVCKQTPLLLVHGKDDQIMKEKYAKQSYQKLINKNEEVQYHSIEKLVHHYDDKPHQLFKNWLQKNWNQINTVNKSKI